MGAVILAVVVLVCLAMMVALVVACRYLGLWTWAMAWLMGTHEEKAQLTKSGQYSMNGYMVSSDSEVVLDATGCYHHYDNVESDLKFLEESRRSSLPPQPLRPAPSVQLQRNSSLLQAQSSVESTDGGGGGDGSQVEVGCAVELIAGHPPLKRAMSCDSVSSDTSIVLEALEVVRTTGQLEIGLEYDSETADLVVTVVQAKDLVGSAQSAVPVDSYVRVFLLPDKTTNMQTRIQKRNNSPVYKERFLFGVDLHELPKRVLLFCAYCIEKHVNTLIGEVELKLADVDLANHITTWLNLVDSNQLNSTDFGDIMFSLSYLPTAERLTVVVVKARNLRWTHNKEMADPFVKVYLLQNGKKISKKKTSVKKDEPNPIFNEAMIFSVPAHALQSLQLRVTVSEFQADGRTPSIGHVIVGSQASGKALSHWNQMITSLRKPIAMWHPLRK